MNKSRFKLSPFQIEFMRRKDAPLVILQTGVGAGKSRALAWWCVYRAMKGERILAVAQNYRALVEVLFREIQIVCSQLGVDFDENKGAKTIRIGKGAIYGATGDNPKGILGFTDFTCAVFDEAAYLPEEAYHFVCDRLRGENVDEPIMRFTSSPSNEPGAQWFRRLCTENASCVIRASSLDNAFTSKKYKLSLIKRYGIGTNLYRQQVLGEFLDSDLEDTLFTHDIIEAVQKRMAPDRSFMDELAIIGLDCARFGGDSTVGLLRIGRKVVKIIRATSTDTGMQADIVVKLADICKALGVRLDCVCVDAAYGSGVIDTLRRLGYKVFEVSFAEKASQAQYYNMRAEMYFNAHSWLKEAGVYRDDELDADLSAQRYMLDDGGKFRLVPKEMIKKVLGRSPDTSDAFALTFYSGALSLGMDMNKKKFLDDPAVLAAMRKKKRLSSARKYDNSDF